MLPPLWEEPFDKLRTSKLLPYRIELKKTEPCGAGWYLLLKPAYAGKPRRRQANSSAMRAVELLRAEAITATRFIRS